MPTYEYICQNCKQVIEVNHKMNLDENEKLELLQELNCNNFEFSNCQTPQDISFNKKPSLFSYGKVAGLSSLQRKEYFLKRSREHSATSDETVKRKDMFAKAFNADPQSKKKYDKVFFDKHGKKE
jgi:hypothetical protein